MAFIVLKQCSGEFFLRKLRQIMSQEIVQKLEPTTRTDTGYFLLGTGLAVASMIIVPALAMRVGLGSSLTGALRIALMKASSQAMANVCRLPVCSTEK